MYHSNPHILYTCTEALLSFNKKSELMLVRRVRAYISSCLQVIWVYLYPFRRKSLFSSQNRQKITKNKYFKVQGQSRSSMLTILKSLSPVDIDIPICNHFQPF